MGPQITHSPKGCTHRVPHTPQHFRLAGQSASSRQLTSQEEILVDLSVFSDVILADTLTGHIPGF